VTEPTALVVTSIGSPNEALRQLSTGALARKMPFYVIGDVPSPIDFYLEGCEFFDIRRQEQTGLRTAAPLCEKESRIPPGDPGGVEGHRRNR
jgi:hypothetical protein